MKGRLENQLKSEQILENKMSYLPDCVQAFYYRLVSEVEYKTAEAYIRYIEHLLKFVDAHMPGKQLTELTTADMDRYFNFIRYKIGKSGVRERTTGAYRGTVYSALNKLFIFLNKEGYISENPLQNLTRPSSTRDNIKQISLTPEEIDILIEQVKTGVGNAKAVARQKKWKDRDLCIVLLFLYTGMRVTALTEININDIDWENQVLHIVDKRDTPFDIPLPKQIIPYIRAWMDTRLEILDYNFFTQPLFISNQKTRISVKSVERIIAKYSANIDKNITPHKLRSTYGTSLYKETGDIYFVQECMGHANIRTTTRYVVKDENAKAKAMDIMSRVIKV